MKNKKIISRVLALSAALILIFALALPCFADEEIDRMEEWQRFYDAYAHELNSGPFEELYANDFGGYDIDTISDLYVFSITGQELVPYGFFETVPYLDLQFEDSGAVGYGYGEMILNFNNNNNNLAGVSFHSIHFSYGTQFYINFEFYDYSANVVAYLSYSFVGGAFILDEVGIGDDVFGPNDIAAVDIAFLLGEKSLSYSDDCVRSLTDDYYDRLSPQGFNKGTSYSVERPDGVVPPARTGLFGQLYYILYEAIYGADAVIGTTQDFILTQIATWMTFAVVLLPILVVAIFLWRVFVR